MSGVKLWVVYVGSMLNLHYGLVHFHMGQWVEPQVIFILHWISGCMHMWEACCVCTSAFFTFSPMSGAKLWVVYVGSMLTLHYSLVHFHTGQWVEPQVIIFILHWISGCTWQKCVTFKSALQPCSLSHWSVTEWVESSCGYHISYKILLTYKGRRFFCWWHFVIRICTILAIWC